VRESLPVIARSSWISAALLALALGSESESAEPKSVERKNPCKCKDLPRMEQELFEQEWLQREFYDYLIEKKTPPKPAPGQTAARALSGQVITDFKNWRGSPAGGGRRGGGAALGMSWAKCELVSYKKGKEVPFDEEKLRVRSCDEVADYLIAHERKHVEQCKRLHDPATPLRRDPNTWMDYAHFDVDAYGEGIKHLRKSIAEVARTCGWAGSTNPTKKIVREQEVDVVPTMAEARRLAKALAAGKKR
jgi:hypothetical protein